MSKASRLQVIVILVAACIMMILTGCSYSGIVISTKLNINSTLSGSRIIKLQFPPSKLPSKSVQAGQLDAMISKSCPNALKYERADDSHGICYTFTLEFDSVADYSRKVQQIIHREPLIVIFNSQSGEGLGAYTSGVRVKEDFSSWELLKWVASAVKGNGWLKGLFEEYRYAGTILDIGGQEYFTDSVINLERVESYRNIEKIKIHTQNNGNGTYDRCVSLTAKYGPTAGLLEKHLFRVREQNSELYATGTTIKGELCSYEFWGRELSLSGLKVYMDTVLGPGVVYEPRYGVEFNDSTIVNERRFFWESLDLSRYCTDGQDVRLEYTYSGSMPIAMGESYESGRWKPAGEMISPCEYTLKGSALSLSVRVPEDIIHQAKSIEIGLDYMGKERFRRRLSIFYSLGDEAALDYAGNYIRGLSRLVSIRREEAGGLTALTAEFEGQAGEISELTQKICGIGNSLTYTNKNSGININNMYEFSDSINLGAMGSSEGSTMPVHYKVERGLMDRLYYLGLKRAGQTENLRVNEDSQEVVICPEGNDFSVSYKMRELSIPKVIVAFLFFEFYIILVIYLIHHNNRITKSKIRKDR